MQTSRTPESLLSEMQDRRDSASTLTVTTRRYETDIPERQPRGSLAQGEHIAECCCEIEHQAHERLRRKVLR